MMADPLKPGSDQFDQGRWISRVRSRFERQPRTVSDRGGRAKPDEVRTWEGKYSHPRRETRTLYASRLE